MHFVSSFDHRKYRPSPVLPKPDRRWPDRQLTAAPRWCSVDLRDGNQALIEPMNPSQKLEMFRLLVDVGFREIEVGFPAASQPDFDFVRHLIEDELIPDDVTIQVLTQARQPIIERTFEALRGAPRAVVHLYNSTSTVQRERVFGLSRDQIKALAVRGAECIKAEAARAPGTDWRFEYSPESFTGTELDYAVEVCDAVIEVWQPTPDKPAIINLPATVEVSTPNVYADQIEWVCDHIARRDSILISLHTHNDRGCGVAAAELAVLAGADRVEGTLLGNGERTGNMDVVTMAMNLYSQGIDPQLDLANMDRIIHTVERCTQIRLHPRHPYAGELVFAAFSGSHQDAINKCLAQHNAGEIWDVAYLPIDPRDVGRDYQQVIRINSQSGKGGVAYVVEQHHGVKLPRWLQVDFSPYVQAQAERSATEVQGSVIASLFDRTYLTVPGAITLGDSHVERIDDDDRVVAALDCDGQGFEIDRRARGVLEAFARGLAARLELDIVVVNEHRQPVFGGRDGETFVCVQISVDGHRHCGAAKGHDAALASFQAVLNALAHADYPREIPTGATRSTASAPVS
ncbi:MAG: 2-isopropylmalate synthase [Myxococcales bacterium FL481]|nr:MAG: 2-isopropylmalate synthase [Myxococcales bacterium FL481]